MTITTPIVDPLGPEGAVTSALAKNVEPFESTVIGYDTVVLNWTSPAAGSWLGIRVVRSRSGYPRTTSDGVIVLDFTQPGWNELNTTTATGLSGGYHYFSLFLKDAFGWQRVAEVDALVPYDYSSTDRMWDNIPTHYRVIRDDTADTSLVNLRINPDLYDGMAGGSVDNLLLSAFISLFGWGFDLLRTQAEYLMNGYDPTVVHVSRLGLLARQFGHTLEEAVPAHVNRTIVRNLASLYRSRGTLEGIHDVVSAVSGWDVEVSIGPNVLLSEDQANFVNPDNPTWDPTVKYGTGDIVEYGNYTYAALQDNLLGYTEAPPATATSNAYWQYSASGYVADTSGIYSGVDVSTWQVALSNPSDTSIGIPYSNHTAVVSGLPDVTGVAQHTNALRVVRNSVDADGGAWLEVRGVNGPDVNITAREQILKAGLPIPRPVKWESIRTYRAGEYVIYKGAAYEALNASTNVLPTTTSDWLRVGADDRIPYTMSVYAHGPFVGTAGTGGKTINSKVYTYNADGTVAQNVAYNSASATFFDPFVDDNTVLDNARTLATGQTWATDSVGTWTVDRDDSGGWVAVPATGKSQRWITYAVAAYSVAVTFTADPGTSRLVGIVFRRSDANNYWIATQTGLYKVVAGAAMANPASGALTWTKFVKGERMRVAVDNGVNTIAVYRGSTLLGTATDSFNNNGAVAQYHGIGAETANKVSNPSMTTNATGYTSNSATVSRSTVWFASSPASLEVKANGANDDSWASVEGDAGGGLRLGMVAGQTYTFTATINTPTALTGTLEGRARRINVIYKNSLGVNVSNTSAAGPTTGSATLSLTVAIPVGATEAYMRLYNGSGVANEVVYWDDVSVVIDAPAVAPGFKDFAVFLPSTGQADPAVSYVRSGADAVSGGVGQAWTRPYITFVPDRDSKYMAPTARVLNPSTSVTGSEHLTAQNFTKWQLERAAANGIPTTYTPAREVQVAVKPDRLNLVPNPSFETNTTGWHTENNVTLARVTTQASSGTASLAMTAVSTASKMAARTLGENTPVTPVFSNTVYTAQAKFRPAATARSVQVDIWWFNASGFMFVTSGTAVLAPLGAWTRATITATSPPTATKAAVQTAVLSPTAGEVHYVDSVVLEVGTNPGDYFDGSSGDDYLWETGGTAHAARSYYYENRLDRSEAVYRSLVDVVPLGIGVGTPKFGMFTD